MSFFKFVAVVVLLAGWALAALSLHVVRTANGVQLIPKNKLSIDDTYVDVRQWTSDDEDKHPAFYARVKQLEQTDVLKPEPESHESHADASKSSLSDAWSRANNNFRGRGR